MESSNKEEGVWGRESAGGWEGSYSDIMISVLEPNTDVYTITLLGGEGGFTYSGDNTKTGTMSRSSWLV